MDYLLSGAGDNNLSLQDMIECDMKTEFCDGTLTPNDIHSIHSPLGLSNDTLSTNDLLNQDSLIAFNSLPNGSVHSIGVPTLTHMTNDLKPDMSWLQNVSLTTDILQNDSISEVFQMVNPQTGLPVQVQTVSQAQVDAISAGSENRTQSGVQYVTATLPQGTTIQQALQGLQQQHLQQTINVAPVTQLQSLNNSQLITQALSNGTAVTLSSVSYPQLIQQQQHSPTSSLVTQQLLNSNNNHLKKINKMDCSSGKVFPKPVYSYSCLIAMSLKNCESGALPVSEIYSFMTENFPYFKTAPDGWKNSVRHNLSLNKCFEKIENPKATGNTRKGCLWGLNPAKIDKMDEEIAKWRKKDLDAIQRSMSKPEVLEVLEKGCLNMTKMSQRASLHNMGASNTPEMMVASPGLPDHIINMAAAAHMPTTKPIVGDIQLSMIEIKPAENGIGHMPVKIKVEPIFTIKPEALDVSGAVGGLSAEDLNLLDTSLSMDPSLSDLAMQNSFWEELGAEGISLDDIPLMSFGPSSSSPLTVQTAKTGLCNAGANSPLVSLLTNHNHSANGASGALTTTAQNTYSLYAQT